MSCRKPVRRWKLSIASFDRFAEITGESFYELGGTNDREAKGILIQRDDALLIEMHSMREKFLAAMDDDFNTGSAISVLFDSLRSLNRHIDQNQLAAGADVKSPTVASLIQAAVVIRELTNVLGLFVKERTKNGQR